MPGGRKCAVRGCRFCCKTFHCFPYNDKEALRIWLERIGCSEPLKKIDRRVCSAHFSKYCILPHCVKKKILRPRSLPTIGLPNFNEEPTLHNSFVVNPLSNFPMTSSEVFNPVSDPGKEDHQQEDLDVATRKIISIDSPATNFSSPIVSFSPLRSTSSEVIVTGNAPSVPETVDRVFSCPITLPNPSLPSTSTIYATPRAFSRPITPPNPLLPSTTAISAPPTAFSSRDITPPNSLLPSTSTISATPTAFSCPITPPNPSQPSTSNICETPTLKKNFRKRLNFLSSVKATRKVQLTPKAKKFHRMLTKLKRTTTNLNISNARYRQKLQQTKAILKSGSHLKSVVNSITYHFILSQIKQQKRHPRGRRFSLNDKVLGLSLYKQNPRGYKLWTKIFAMPGKSVLRKLGSNISLHSGLNNNFMENLKHSVSKMGQGENICTLIFDEIALQANLEYNLKGDLIEGFVDLGNINRVDKFADHALVFMARGIRRKWKQPVAYFLTDGGLKGEELAPLIELVIRALRDAGLNIVATVCDQHPTNRSAYNILKKNVANSVGFQIDNIEVIPLFDPPHLLKCLRNNLMKHNARFVQNGITKTASWSVIKSAYETDSPDCDYKVLNKLTDGHIYADKMNKMKVCVAAQVLSQRVSAIIRMFDRFGVNLGREVQPIDTADFILFFDKLFDSVNGSTLSGGGSKLRTAVTRNSEHHVFWEKALIILQSIKFFDQNKNSYFTPPTIKGWIQTIKGFQHIWAKLNSNYNFTSVCLRNINQDPLENFFGCIRQHGARNVNPSSYSFQNSYKSYLINNIMSTHSPGANCEQDDSEGGILNIKELITFRENTCSLAQHATSNTQELRSQILSAYSLSEADVLTDGVTGYVAGYVARKLRDKVATCNSCTSSLVGSPTGRTSEIIIHARSYRSKDSIVEQLQYPTSNFMSLVKKYGTIFRSELEIRCTSNNLSQQLKSLFDERDFQYFCPSHQLKQKFIDYFVKFYTVTWIKNINFTLKGLDELHSHEHYYPMRQKACCRYQKYKRNKSKTHQISCNCTVTTPHTPNIQPTPYHYIQYHDHTYSFVNHSDHTYSQIYNEPYESDDFDG